MNTAFMFGQKVVGLHSEMNVAFRNDIAWLWCLLAAYVCLCSCWVGHLRARPVYCHRVSALAFGSTFRPLFPYTSRTDYFQWKHTVFWVSCELHFFIQDGAEVTEH